MKVTNEAITMSLEELDNELSSGSDLAEEIASLVMNSSEPWSLVEERHGKENLLPAYSKEEEEALRGITKSRVLAAM